MFYGMQSDFMMSQYDYCAQYEIPNRLSAGVGGGRPRSTRRAEHPRRGGTGRQWGQQVGARAHARRRARYVYVRTT
eukprot:COSAG02_NODE_57_length_43668_cov_118.217196_17_plen_76_part_00